MLELIFLGSFFVYSVVLLVAFFWNVILWASRPRSPTVAHPVVWDGPPPTVLVTLVHGTWSQQASWTQADSGLCQSIRGALPNDTVRFLPFQWSGRNSISARHKAGEALAETLRASQERWPQARHLIVGHSHGGGVALRALRSNIVSKKVIQGVICLSTPFLIARFRSLNRLAKVGISITPALIVIFGLPQLLRLFDVIPLIDRNELLPGLFAILLIAAGIFVAHYTPRMLRSLANRVFVKMQLAELESDQLLIIRYPGDEASAALGAVQILNYVVSRIWGDASHVLDSAILRADEWCDVLHTLGWRLHVINVALVTTAVIIALKGASFSGIIEGATVSICLLSIAGISWLLYAREAGKFLGLLLLGAVAAPLPFLLALLALPFGPELALVSLILSVTAEPTPTGTWIVRQASPVDTDGSQGLMHSLAHTDPAALATVAGWIQERVLVRA